MHHAQQTCANQIGRGKQIPTQKGKTRCTQIQIGSKSRRTKGREGFLSHEFVVQSLNPPSQILTLEERRKEEKQNQNTGEDRRGDGNDRAGAPGKGGRRLWSWCLAQGVRERGEIFMVSTQGSKILSESN